MGTVTRLPRPEPMALGEAVETFLAHGVSERSRGTYRSPLRALVEEFGAATPVEELKPEPVAAWYQGRWPEGSVKPVTRSNVCTYLHGAAVYWQGLGWLTHDPFRLLKRPRSTGGVRLTDKAIPPAELEALLGDNKLPLRDRLLWVMLYETGARVSEIIQLDVGDLDLRPGKRCTKEPIRAKGNKHRRLHWQSGTAQLLPRYLKGRKAGPLLLTDLKVRSDLRRAGTDIYQPTGQGRLSIRMAQYTIEQATEGRYHLHQLRHTKATEMGRKGADAKLIAVALGHESVATTAGYLNYSDQDVADWQSKNDPAAK